MLDFISKPESIEEIRKELLALEEREVALKEREEEVAEAAEATGKKAVEAHNVLADRAARERTLQEKERSVSVGIRNMNEEREKFSAYKQGVETTLTRKEEVLKEFEKELNAREENIEKVEKAQSEREARVREDEDKLDQRERRIRDAVRA
jgi:hypothetical protein